jgi:hypothetical protein
MRPIRFLLILILYTAFFGAAEAQTITGIKLKESKVSPGATVALSIEFKSENSNWCGFSIDWGEKDSKQDIRIGDPDRQISPFYITRTYSSPGTFIIGIKGQYLSRGLKSAGACEVNTPSVQLTVTDPVAEQMARNAEQERLRAEQRLNFEKAQADQKARMEREQAELVKRQLEDRQLAIAQRELELKKRELELKEAELRRASAATPPLNTKEDERRRASEERERVARERQIQAQAAKEAQEAERQRLAEERQRVAAARREQAEAERARLVQAKEDIERRKREAAEAALLRPMISSQDPRLACQSKWDSMAELSVIAKRISLSSLGDISFQMLADNATPNQREQQAIAFLADNFRKCINESSTFRQQTYSKELTSILNSEDSKILELSLDLYNKKMTFGKYNLAIQQVVKDTKTKLEELAERLKSESARQQELARTRAAEAEEAAKARQAALIDAQQRQEQQRRADMAAQEQARRAAEARQRASDERRAEARQKWEARCQFDAKNAYERYMRSKENDCASRNRGLAVLCAAGVVASANDYQKSAFDSCMSGAP